MIATVLLVPWRVLRKCCEQGVNAGSVEWYVLRREAVAVGVEEQAHQRVLLRYVDLKLWGLGVDREDAASQTRDVLEERDARVWVGLRREVATTDGDGPVQVEVQHFGLTIYF